MPATIQTLPNNKGGQSHTFALGELTIHAGRQPYALVNLEGLGRSTPRKPVRFAVEPHINARSEPTGRFTLTSSLVQDPRCITALLAMYDAARDGKTITATDAKA